MIRRHFLALAWAAMVTMAVPRVGGIEEEEEDGRPFSSLAEQLIATRQGDIIEPSLLPELRRVARELARFRSMSVDEAIRRLEGSP